VQQVIYPPVHEDDLIGREPRKRVVSLAAESVATDSDSIPPIPPYISGTIWSMCFISKNSNQSSKEQNPVLAVVVNRYDFFDFLR